MFQKVNLHIAGVPEGKEMRKDTQNVFNEIMPEHFFKTMQENGYVSLGKKH